MGIEVERELEVDTNVVDLRMASRISVVVGFYDLVVYREVAV